VPVATENPIRPENTEVLIIREIMVATTMSSLFVALLASSFRTRAALQVEILALRHQLAVFQKNAPLSRSKPVASTSAFLERKCRFSLTSPTKLLLMQNWVLSQNGLPALGSTRRLSDAEAHNPSRRVRLSTQ
jgi:hypothetical protein